MYNFRDHTPIRSAITTVVTTHRDHRANLKTDFISRCGYCNSIDNWKTTYFEIDHFIPAKILTIKTTTDYSNLVYSCRSCNNAKRKKWPTNDENVPNRNNEGFIDPCDTTYKDQFYRDPKGKIMYNTPLGAWMHLELNLFKPQHQIIWNIEEVEKMIEESEALIKKINNPVLETRLLNLYRTYKTYVDQFRAV